jgi:hypothetical protein
VSCLAGNHLRKELLAVGYGQYEFDSQQGGLVAFWSLKNPRWPDWVFHSHCGVTALAFSKLQPSLLAVGFYDGMVRFTPCSHFVETPMECKLPKTSMLTGFRPVSAQGASWTGVQGDTPRGEQENRIGILEGRRPACGYELLGLEVMCQRHLLHPPSTSSCGFSEPTHIRCRSTTCAPPPPSPRWSRRTRAASTRTPCGSCSGWSAAAAAAAARR